MSDALKYLLEVRPEAMRDYFRFLKRAGEHLDPRTRDLISVITKVAVQTEPGFRQYLNRALDNGASPQEIIDALLMAFPVLGLAKIIWAVEILLQMDLPEFAPDRLNGEPEWHDLGTLDAFPEGAVSRVTCAGRGLFVDREGEAIRIYDARCPHQRTEIPHLALEGRRLTCPKHHWVFDLTTGDCVEGGNRPLRRFAHRIQDGHLLAYW